MILRLSIRQAYTEAMPIHPLFMDEDDFNDPNVTENNPALDAINRLIESATPRERAAQCKLDGNQFFDVARSEKKDRAKREENMKLALGAYVRSSVRSWMIAQADEFLHIALRSLVAVPRKFD